MVAVAVEVMVVLMLLYFPVFSVSWGEASARQLGFRGVRIRALPSALAPCDQPSSPAISAFFSSE